MNRALNFIKIKISESLNHDLFKKIIDYILVFMCIVCSGYALFTGENTTPRTIFTLVTCLLILVRYVLSFRIDYFKLTKKDKKNLIPLPTFFCFLIIALSASITLLSNGESSYFISYIYFGLLVISAVLLCRIIPFDRFKNIFCNIIFYLSIISILIFLFYRIAPSVIGVPFIGDNNNAFFNTSFVNFQTLYYNRSQSIFWEPGVAASYILIALALELLFLKKGRISHVVVYIIATILTFSTASYFLLPIIILPAIIERIKKDNVKTVLEFVFVPLVFGIVTILLAFSKDLEKYLPDLLSKVSSGAHSFSTRLLSPKIDFEIFCEKPLFGWGIHGANVRYLEIASTTQYANLIDAQTSTSVGLIAKFGVLGFVYTLMAIFGIVFYKKAGPLSLVSFLLVFLIIINKEPHGNMLVSWAIPFYFVYESFDLDIIKKRERRAKLKMSNNSLLDILRQKNHSGVVARNTFLSFGLKGFALLVGLFTIPVYSKYFNNDSTYGIWLTFLSIISWVMTFDLGFGNGMKNKLIESISRKDNEEGKKIVSSTYGFSLLIGSVILSVGLLVINLIDPVKIFNFDANSISSRIVTLSFSITFATIAIEFVLKNICHIFQAHQKHFLSNLLPLIANVGLLLFALIAKFDDVSTKLLVISIAYAIITLFPYVVSTVIAFLGPLKHLRPGIKYFSLKKSKSIVSLGLLFFLVQMSLLLLNSADQIIISSMFSSESVVAYTKYSKFFNVILSISNIFNNIIWTSVCKSISDNNNSQLKKGIKLLLIFDVLMCVLCAIIALFMQPIMDVWLGSSTFTVDYFIVVILLFFTIENIFVSSTGSLLNGFQCLIPQAISIGSAAILKIVLLVVIHYLAPSMQWEIVFIVNLILWAPILVVNIFFLIKRYKKQVRKGI